MSRAITISKSRSSAIQIKKMLQKLGYSDVATGDFQNLPRISQPSIAVVEYQYLAYERIVNIIESLVKRNVFIILHSPVKEELMFSAVCSLYAYFVTPFRGLFNLDSLKETLGQSNQQETLVSSLAKLDRFIVKAPEQRVFDLIESNEKASDYLLSTLFVKRRNLYRQALAVCPPSQLASTHFIKAIRYSIIESRDNPKLSKLAKASQHAFAAKQALSFSKFNDGHYQDAVSLNLECLEMHPLDKVTIERQLIACLLEGNLEPFFRAIRQRQRFAPFTIDHFKSLCLYATTQILEHDWSYDKLLKGRKNYRSPLKSLEKSFGLANKTVFQALVKSLFFLVCLQSKHKPSSIVLISNESTRRYSDPTVSLLHKSIQVEIGNIRETKQLFRHIKGKADLTDSTTRHVYSINRQRLISLSEQISRVLQRKESRLSDGLKAIYEQYPYSIELNMYLAQQLLANSALSSEQFRHHVAKNLRLLNINITLSGHSHT